MSPQSTNLTLVGALMLAAAGLGLYAYFGVMKGEESEQARKELSEKVFADHASGDRSADGGLLPPPVFTQLTVTARGETTALEKIDGRWRITAPIQTLADSAVLDNLTSQLNNAKFKSTVEEKPTADDLVKYGLKNPTFVVKAAATGAAGAKRELTLYGGIENTFDGSVYLRKDADTKVYAADGALRLALDKTTFDLRNKDVFSPIDETKLKAIAFKSKANSYALETDDPKTWRLTKPQPLPADGAAVAQMVAALKSERALAFPKDTPEARKLYGLATPQVELELTFVAGPPTRVTLSKVSVDNQEHVYGLQEQGTQASLVELSAAVLTAFDKAPKDLRDKSVLRVNRDAVAKAVFTPAGGGTEIVVEKTVADAGESDEWRVIAPKAGNAKKWKMSSVMWTLTSLKASELGVENPKDWNKFGIDSKSRTATLYDASGKELAKLWVGKDVPGKKSTAYVRGSRAQVFEMDTSRLTELPDQIEDVLDVPPKVTAAPNVPDAGTGTAPAPLPN